MRVTVSLDEDLYRIAKAFAQTEDVSLSRAINEMLRRAAEGPGAPNPPHATAETDFPVSASSAFTSADVDQIDDVDAGLSP